MNNVFLAGGGSFCTAHQLLRKHCDFKGGGDVHRSPKIGNKGSFCSPNAFNSNFDNSTVCLETRLSPFAQNDHLKPKLSLCCHFAMKPER